MRENGNRKNDLVGNTVRVLTGRVSAVMAAMSAVMLLTGCGGAYDGSYSEFNGQGSNSYSSTTASDSYYDYGLDMAPEASSEEAYESGKNQAADALSQRKLIRTVNMEVETKEFDQLMNTLERQVQSIGGYIENMESYNGSSYNSNRSNRYANLTLRIPKNELDGFLELVSDVGNVVRRNESVEDVTLSYVDLESHRNALRTEQERLLALLEQAETLEDILTIEDRLSNVRYQLESMESRLRTMDNQVDYSTVYLRVSEVQELTPVVEQTVWDRITEGFSDSLENIRDIALEVMIRFAVNTPYLVLLAVIAAVVLICVKVSMKYSAKKATKKKEEELKSQQKGTDIPGQG